MNPAIPANSIDQFTASIVANLARAADAEVGKPKVANYQDAAPYVVLRDASGAERVHHLDGKLAPPARKTGTVTVNDADSFCAYYGIHGSGAPVYAQLEPAGFLAVLNDHTKDAAGHRDFKLDFPVRHSREWTVWTKHNGKGAAFNSNESFALFLEDNAVDIHQPAAAQMLAIALNFRVKADVAFANAVRLEDGNTELAFSNVVTGSAAGANGGKVKIPEQFKIRVPVFEGLNAKLYEVDARFRYRLTDGKLSIWYELVRPHKVVEAAFKDIWQQIEKATKAPILNGRPE